MQEAESFKIVLHVQRREDGGLRVWSDDVPGLVLSNANPEKVLADIKPAIEAILSEVFGCEVEAYRVLRMKDAMTRARRPAGQVRAPATPAPRALPRGRTLEYAAIACA